MNGKEVIPHIYEKADCFYMGYAAVVLNGKTGLIDLKGIQIIPCEFDNDLLYFENNLALIKKDGKFGYIDVNADIIIPIIYDEAEDFSNGKAKVKRDDTWLLIDKTGKEFQK